MAPAIPDGWLEYKPIGKRIEGTRFIAFKVPLNEHVVQTVNEKMRLDGKLLLMEIPNLGLIIDLTNTNRYYNPDFFERKGVGHQKLMIPGHATPPNNLVNQFKLHVLNFLDDNRGNDKLIGVHCTHGVNRTGYLICNYMISEMAMTPKEAIRKFNVARGHEIERINYIEALYGLQNRSYTANIMEEYGKPVDSRRSRDDSVSLNAHKMSNPTHDSNELWRERHVRPEPDRYARPERFRWHPDGHFGNPFDRNRFRAANNQPFGNDLRSTRMERSSKAFESTNNQRYHEPTSRTFTRFSNTNPTDEFERTSNKFSSTNSNRFSYSSFGNERETTNERVRPSSISRANERFNLPMDYVDKRSDMRQRADVSYERNSSSYKMHDRAPRVAIRREHHPYKDATFYQRNAGYSSRMSGRPTADSTNYGNSLPRTQYADVRERKDSYSRGRDSK